jgi:hypothetical protein
VTVYTYLRGVTADVYDNTDLIAPSAVISGTGINFSLLKHGIGNLMENVIPQNYMSLFQYEYTHVAYSQAGRPVFLTNPASDCGGSYQGGPWDESKFLIGTLNSNPDTVGMSYKPIGCTRPTDFLNHLGCALASTLSVANCAVQFPTVPGDSPGSGLTNCNLCAQGYGLILISGVRYGCVACPANCLTCAVGGATCTVCADGYLRTKSAANYVCTARTPTSVYNPVLQSEFTDASITPGTFNLNGGTGSYESISTVNVPSTGTVVLETSIDIPYSSSEAAKYDVHVYIGGNLVQVRTVPYQAGNPATYTMKIYAAVNNLAANANLEVKIVTAVAVSYSAGSSFKAGVQVYNTGANCMFSNAAGDCLVCNNNLGYYLSGTSCVAIPTGQYATSPGFAKNDQLANCANTPAVTACTGPSVGQATACANSYYLSSGVCLACNGNCATCVTSATNCLTCSSPPYLQSVGNTCVAACNTNQYLSSNTCYNCDASCLTCSAAGSTSCSTCAAGKYLSGGSCLTCDTNCLTCQTTATNCLTCGVTFPKLQPGSPNTCVASCNSNQFDNAGTCTNCDSSCLTCTTSGTTGCSSCAAGKYLTGSSSCLTCNGNCATCVTSATNCLTCSSPPYLQSVGNTCVAACNTNQYLSSNTCYNCDASCLTCSAAGSTSCSTCASGKYLNGGSCLSCDSTCLTCSGSATNCVTCGGSFPLYLPGSPNTCVASCNSNQFDNAGTCTNCDSSCLTCSGAGSLACTSCAASKYLTGSNSCAACDSSCLTCSGSASTQCLTCPPNFMLSGTNTCDSCDSTCLTCSGPASTQCLTCAAPRLFTSTSCGGPGCCHSCPIANCAECSADNVCSRCATNFSLASPTQCEAVVATTTTNSTSVAANSTSTGTTSSQAAAKVQVKASVNKVKWMLNLVFSSQIKFKDLAGKVVLDYDKTLFAIGFDCENVTGSGNSCSNPITFKDGVEVSEFSVTLHIKDAINLVEEKSTIDIQTVKVSEPVSYYIDSASSAQSIKQTFSGTKTVMQVSQGAALFSSSTSFSGFIKLTQSIEMAMYFNVNEPQNYQSFLTFFSQNIFSLAYNPLQTLFNEGCDLPRSFNDNGMSCSFFVNTGQNFLVFGILIAIKLAIFGGLKLSKKSPAMTKVFQFCDQMVSLNLLMMLVDALMFDYLVAAILTLRTTNLSSPSGIIDLIGSLGAIGFYVLEMTFVFFYCRAMHALKDQETAPTTLLSRHGSMENNALQIAKPSLTFTKISSEPGEKPSKSNPMDSSPKGQPGSTKPGSFLSRFKILHYIDEKNVEFLSGRYCILIDQSKTFLCTIILVAFHDYPFAQIGLIAACQTGVCLWYIFRRPYSTLKETIKSTSTESLLSLTMLACLLMTPQSSVLQAPADRYLYLGYPLIVLSSVLFITVLAFNAYETFHMVKEKIQNLRKDKKAEIVPLRSSQVASERIIPIDNLKDDPFYEPKGDLSPTTSQISTAGKSTKIRVSRELKLAVKSGLSPTFKPKKIGSHMINSIKIKKTPFSGHQV